MKLRLSKYLTISKVSDGTNVIYNNLLFIPIFVNDEEKENIINFKVDEQTKQQLVENGIYTTSSAEKQVLQELKQMYLEQTRKPTFAYFAVTNNCNLRCKYCFIENNACNCESNTMTDEIATVAVDKIDKFCQANDIDKFEIIFYGGEPLVAYELIQNVVKYCKKKKTKFTFTAITNATLLTDDKVSFFKKNDVKLGISIDGPKYINDKNRVFASNEGSVYDTIIEKVKMLKESGVIYNLSMTISEDMLNNKEDVINWVKSLNVDYIAFNLLHFTSKGDWKSFYEKASQFLFYADKELKGHIKSEDRVARNWNIFTKSMFKFSDCGATGMNQITIKPNGEVVICHGDIKTGKNIFGNILTDSIEDILNKKQSDMWIKRCPIYKKKCLKCPAIYVCGGGCANQSGHLFGNVKKIDKPFCIFTKHSVDHIIEKCYNKINN